MGRRAAFLHEPAELFAQFADTLSGQRGHGEHRGTGLAVFAERHAVLVEQSAQIVEHLVGGVAGQPVHLVEHDEADLRVARQRAQVALVEHGVRVLLGVHDPHDRVHEREDPVGGVAVRDDRRVEVRQIDQDQALQVAVRAVDGPSAQPAGDPEPVEQACGAVGPTARDGRPGGGNRRSPVSKSGFLQGS